MPLVIHREPLPTQASEEAIAVALVDIGSVAIRDVDAGEKPFVYSSGNQGPGYVDVKGSVGAQETFKFLVDQLAAKAVRGEIDFDAVAGNATGGMVPAYEFRERVQAYRGTEIFYNYVRGTRKEGGHGEHITGLQHIPRTRPDGTPTKWVVMEELVNFATTTTNSALLLRGEGFVVDDAVTILNYDHDMNRALLAETNVHLTALITLPGLLDALVASGRMSSELIAKYRTFQADPQKWMDERGLVKVDRG
jgi:orotate phosphoribosyltransferase